MTDKIELPPKEDFEIFVDAVENATDCDDAKKRMKELGYERMKKVGICLADSNEVGEAVKERYPDLCKRSAKASDRLYQLMPKPKIVMADDPSQEG